VDDTSIDGLLSFHELPVAASHCRTADRKIARKRRIMPNDAKLGLVVGMGLVIAAAVGFARKEPAATAEAESAAMVHTSPDTIAQPTSRTSARSAATSGSEAPTPSSEP
jgi:hypothetical protein